MNGYIISDIRAHKYGEYKLYLWNFVNVNIYY